MIKRFEHTVRERPHDSFFYYVDENEKQWIFSYEETKQRAVTLALHLGERGIGRGSYIAVDLPNCPVFVILALAAAYGGFSIVALNHRLTDEEKNERLFDLRLADATRIGAAFDEPMLWALTELGAQSLGVLSHFAGRAGAVFDRNARALVMFTSGTTGKPKAVALTWNNLCSAAEASNVSLNVMGKGLWQAVLPLFHIGGFQIPVRCVLNDIPFVLYHRFDAQKVLTDSLTFGATHISVVDKMLQDMLDVDAGNDESSDSLENASGSSVASTGARGAVGGYRCVLLGGASLNPVTAKRALAAKARVYASYGMTETSSQIASSQLTASFDGGLATLPGYEVQIVNPNEAGSGQLAVRASGVFGGYLNARTAFTADGFFLTGDTASIKDGKLYVQERTGDMFISGGENIYPAEIVSKLLRVPQVRDAVVFGVDDAVWGKRPVAFVERDRLAVVQGKTLQQFSAVVCKSLEQRLSKLYRPKPLCALNEFPRTGVGKVDRRALQSFYAERIEVKRVTLYRIDQKFRTPVVTAKTILRSRESLIVEVEDWAGRTGLGECVAFPTDWYLPETLGEDRQVLEEHLIPLVLNQIYLHPSEVSANFDACVAAAGFPLAKGALEPALWDLYGKIVEKPLWQLIGGTKTERVEEMPERSRATAEVNAGAVLGIMPISETLDEVGRLVEAGYRRVKLKIKPGDDLARVVAVRGAFPEIIIMLDANQSYTEQDRETLMAFDRLDICCIEEPLDPRNIPAVGPTDLFDRLARLQRLIETPICLDESVVTADNLAQALKRPDLSCFALKIAKAGGVQKALELYDKAQELGIKMWMGGMYDTALSKRLHAAFETLPGMNIPGDLSEATRYFEQDITCPPFTVEDGSVVLNPQGFEAGLGCNLDWEAIERVLVERSDYKNEIDFASGRKS